MKRRDRWSPRRIPPSVRKCPSISVSTASPLLPPRRASVAACPSATATIVDERTDTYRSAVVGRPATSLQDILAAQKSKRLSVPEKISLLDVSALSEHQQQPTVASSPLKPSPTHSVGGTVSASAADSDSVFTPATTPLSRAPSSVAAIKCKKAGGRGGRRSDVSFSFASTTASDVLNSPRFSTVLGEARARRISRYTLQVQSLDRTERCFYALLLLVTFIYSLGILTALVLLFFHRWFFEA